MRNFNSVTGFYSLLPADFKYVILDESGNKAGHVLRQKQCMPLDKCRQPRGVSFIKGSFLYGFSRGVSECGFTLMLS